MRDWSGHNFQGEGEEVCACNCSCCLKKEPLLNIMPGRITEYVESVKVVIIPPRTIFSYVKSNCFSCGKPSPKSKYCWENRVCLPEERAKVLTVLEMIAVNGDNQRWINAIDPDHPSYDPDMFGFLSRLGSAIIPAECDYAYGKCFICARPFKDKHTRWVVCEKCIPL